MPQQTFGIGLNHLFLMCSNKTNEENTNWLS